MKLLGKTRKLEIITENCHESEEKYPEISCIKYPLYEANYINGVRTIFQRVIEENEDNKEKLDYGKHFIANKRSNILSFMGGRGTGKTTAMDEFCRILFNLKYSRTKKWWLEHTLSEEEQLKLQNKNFYFHILKPIDASLLAEKEDLFELILSNLFHEFEDKMKKDIQYGFKDNPKIREIMNDFSEISRLYHNMRIHKTEDAGNAFFSQIQLMAGSQEIQNKVTNLIENLISLEKTDCQYEYIVIAIDDLDLNLKNGYEMLEQLQKYFSDSRIIVLVAIDYEQMQLVCEEHFWHKMPQTSKIYEKEHNRDLAYDYMIKIFHLSQRMYMPDMHRISKKSQIKLPKEIKTRDNKGNLSVKEFTLIKISDAMGIFYDSCGIKDHFSEPETVRQLVSYNAFLESLNPIEFSKLIFHRNIKNIQQRENNIEILKQYDQNHEHFNEDINVRMVNNLLTHEQKVAFENLKQQDLQRRAKYFVYAERTDIGIKFGNITGESYCYGDLLEKIYGWGRNGNYGDYFEDKPFIRCVLASFTSEMVCEYIKYRYNPDEKRRKKYRARLVGFMGESFANKWVGTMFPMIRTYTIQNMLEKQMKMLPFMIYGYANNVNQQMVRFFINIEKLKELQQEIENIESDKEPSLESLIGKWLEDEQVIETLECIDMFFIRMEGDSYRGCDFEFSEVLDERSPMESKPDVDEKVKISQNVMMVTGSGENVKLDIMAFVAKSLDYNGVQEYLHNSVKKNLTKFLAKYLGVSNDFAKVQIIESVIEQYFMKEKLYSTCKKHGADYEVAFPFYNLDISYNIMKRVRERFKGKVIDQRDIMKELNDFYNCIDEFLTKEKDIYMKIEDDTKNIFSYDSIFRKSPYIKAFENWYGTKEKIPERLQQVFYNVGIKHEIDVTY